MIFARAPYLKQELAEFVRERDAALALLDEEKIRDFAKKHHAKLPEDEEAFWREVHTARCRIFSLPNTARKRSEDWLYEHEGG